MNTESKHSPEMIKIIESYENSVDKELYDFVNDVVHERSVKPVTVGYLSDNQVSMIKNVLPEKIDLARRCTIDADAIRHIIDRHGKTGKADQSMSDTKDIARMAYVLANFDEVYFEGNYSSKKYKMKDGTLSPHITIVKRINGTYYIIEAVADSKANKSHIVSAYIR